jgi:hypothetical protein
MQIGLEAMMMLVEESQIPPGRQAMTTMSQRGL